MTAYILNILVWYLCFKYLPKLEKVAYNKLMTKPISPRTKIYKENARRGGWHLHLDNTYKGYDPRPLHEIIAEMKYAALTAIMGNVLIFERTN